MIANTAAGGSTAKRLGEAVKEWMHEGAAKTVAETQRAVGWFVRFVGAERGLDTVKRREVGLFRATLG